jgi:hypothetical protein
VPCILFSITPDVHSKATLLSVFEETLVLAAIVPFLNAITVLDVIDPFSFVGRSVSIVELTIPVRFVIEPVTY